jgi:hypothetical protein
MNDDCAGDAQVEDWEKFIPNRTQAYSSETPVLRYYAANHRFTLSKLAWTNLGAPEAIDAQYNRKTKTLLIRPGSSIKLNHARNNTLSFQNSKLSQFLNLEQQNKDWQGRIACLNLQAKYRSIVFDNVPD